MKLGRRVSRIRSENYWLNGKGKVYIQGKFVWCHPSINFPYTYYVESKLLPHACLSCQWWWWWNWCLSLNTRQQIKEFIYFKLKQKITWHCLNIYTRSHIVQNQACSYDKRVTNQIRVTNSLKALKQKKVQFENHIPYGIFMRTVFPRLLYSYKNLKECSWPVDVFFPERHCFPFAVYRNDTKDATDHAG